MNHHEPQESIAIVGMAGRFPKAANLDEFWRNLRQGVEGVSFFRDDQVQWLPIEHAPDLKDPRYVKARAVLDKPEWFDAGFFGMTPQEARVMDPQHRVFLECCWEALEHAGCNPEAYAGMIGVFAGASMNTYLFTNLLTNRDLVANLGIFPAMIANDGDFVPTRVSYKLNLRGPSINVQTACSTSLVAVCLAAQSLLSYRCDMALAGGVSITFPPNRGQHHLEGGILSPDGHCRAFDAKAAGTVLGDGAGVVALKRLSDALADGDHICAVIKGTAINNDGSVKIGYTAPSIDGQAEVIAMAQAEAGFAPETISYVEAHGTGTPLGDPIEIAGLTKAFGLSGQRGQFCAIGSVKSNIGHLDIGAGVAGLIKTVLALQHGEIPPSLHFEQPNPKIDFANSPFFVNRTLRPWPRGTQPRRAGVSSFGIGGTNSHVAIEEAPATEPTRPARPGQLLVLSAKTASALDAATNRLADHLECNPSANLADVAFTLQVGRKVFPQRRTVVCAGVADAVQALRSRDPKRVVTGGTEAESPAVAFMFPGQGAQAVNMARELYDVEPGFRADVDRSCEWLQPRLGLDLRDVLFPGRTFTAGGALVAPRCDTRSQPTDRVPDDAAKLLTETRLTQPALFVIEHALAQVWIRWGIKPAAMIGHSLGEYVAACLAGVFSLEDALALVAERARLMQAQPAGAMLAVRVPEARIAEFLDNTLALAAVNAPSLCVVSGPFDAIDAMERRLAAGAIPFKRLATSHAFHSGMMEPALRPLADFIRRLTLNRPKLPWVSNVTGTWITPEQATSAEYWVKHLRQTVRFADGIATLMAGGNRVLLEVGPGATLAGLARQHPATGGGAATVLATLGRTQGAPGESAAAGGNGARENHTATGGDRAAMLQALGQLWLASAAIDWRGGFHRDERRQIVPLPTYPFERKRHWVEPGMTFQLGGVVAANGVAPATALEAETIPAAVDSVVVNGGADHPPLAAPVAKASGTMATLKQIFQELSGIDLAGAGPDESFYQLGFDSLFLTQASQAVGRRFALDITFRQLREELTCLGKLAAYIEARTAPRNNRRDTEHTEAKGESQAAGEVPGRRAPGAAVVQPRLVVQGSEKRIPLTDPQREMWFASQLGSAVSSAYNEESTLQLEGALDVAALHRALRQLVARHEALRTTFAPAGDLQRIAPTGDVELPVTDFSTLEPKLRATRVSEMVNLHIQRPFDFVHGPLFRVLLLRLEPQRHLLVLVVHHIICDGWSLGTLVRELGELYAAEAAGRAARLPAPVSFSEYAERHTAAKDTPAFTAAGEFWRGQFADGVPVLELPSDRPRPPARTYAGGHVLRSLPPELTTALKQFCAERNCTLFTALFATFNVMLHRLSGQDDLVVGVPSAAQVMDGAGNLVGHFANLLPVRSRLNDTQRFSEYLTNRREQMVDVLDHWRYPFSRLVQDLKLARDASRMPLANVVFNSSRLRGELRFGDIAVEANVTPKRFVNFDLNFNCALTEDTITLGCYYSAELFDEATIGRWFEHFETLLRGVVAAPEAAVRDLPLLDAAQHQRVVVEWNHTAAEYPRNEGVQERFFALAQAEPGAIALMLDDRQLSYGELAARARRLAARLRGLGVGRDVAVGICLERSFEMIVAVLAVLEAGGAYVPLDPAYPSDRLSFMVEDSRAPVLLTQRSLRTAVPVVPGVQTVCLDDPTDPSDRTDRTDRTDRGPARDPESLAYIIYTSGSTGKPKGVAMPHRPLSNLIAWQLRESRVGKGGRTLQFASLSFDVSFQEIFATLGAGGTLVLVDDMRRRDMRELWRIIGRRRIERLFLPFVALQSLADAFKPEHADTAVLREIITAGEPLQITPKICALFTALGDCTLHNQYGPSEAHVVTAYTLAGAPRRWPTRPSIGRPIANTQIYLLDRAGRPVPVGVPGELCIGGDCLARGYLNRPELTAEKFVPNPFSGDQGPETKDQGPQTKDQRPKSSSSETQNPEPGTQNIARSAQPETRNPKPETASGARLYRTGDLARYDADGNIEFIGRVDHQVKVNGYRVELGEIEAVLRQHPAIRECVVIVREDEPGNRRLVGYFVVSGTEIPALRELRTYLQQRLPDYMVPAAFVVLDKIPLTPSGKADRRSLPPPDASVVQVESAGPGPRTTAEELIAEIWRDVLGLKQIGVHANFFELGGHSLLAAQVLARVQETLEVELPLARFFSGPTIAELAGVAEELLLEQINAGESGRPASAAALVPAKG